jgi:LDH2 family malate/lactate/ureidoglycolate dehydrogenase
MMGISAVRVPVDALEQFTYACFKQYGLSDEEARGCTHGLIQSELRYHPGQGQGVRRLPTYRERINNGLFTVGAQYEIVKQSEALALVDAHNGLGSPIAQRSMRLAIEKAKRSGSGTVIVRNSNHYGSSSVHALLAVEEGCIGIALTNAGPEMAPWGAASGVVGTNPWGIAAPTGGEFPVVLDIALTTAGKGMMQWLEREGKKMPLDWALTPDGHETDDPASAMKGALLAIGQYKGYGLSFMTDMLTGVIAGGAFGLTPYSKPTGQEVSHTFIALDIEWFMPLADFNTRMNAFVAECKSATLRPGFNEILVPGELEHRREQERRRDGVLLDLKVFDELKALADQIGVAFAFAREVVS